MIYIDINFLLIQLFICVILYGEDLPRESGVREVELSPFAVESLKLELLIPEPDDDLLLSVEL